MIISTKVKLLALGICATLIGIQLVVRCAPGTFMMQTKELLMLAWPTGSDYGFVVIPRDGSAGASMRSIFEAIGWGGQKTDAITFSKFIFDLTKSGRWTYTDLTGLPLPVVTVLQSFTITALETMPTFLVLPAGNLNDVWQLLQPLEVQS